MDIPLWALALVYWLHMLATVVWIGGLAALSILVLPAAHKALDVSRYAAFLNELQRRLDPLGWFSLALLAGTGMVQMSANPNYQGLLAIDNQWAAAILVKHLVIVGMVGMAGYISWGLLPRLRRLALRLALAQKDASSADSALAEKMVALRRQEIILLRLNLVLGIVVLALTAVARSA